MFVAIGPYSQAVKANGLVFVSGMMPATKDGKQVEGSVAEKTHQMCRNAKAVLEAAGSGLGKAVKVTVGFFLSLVLLFFFRGPRAARVAGGL